MQADLVVHIVAVAVRITVALVSRMDAESDAGIFLCRLCLLYGQEVIICMYLSVT